MASILSEGIGYVIPLGVGLIMAIAVTLLVRWLGTRKTFEWFYTAGRNVKTGLRMDVGSYPFVIFYCGISIRH